MVAVFAGRHCIYFMSAQLLANYPPVFGGTRLFSSWQHSDSEKLLSEAAGVRDCVSLLITFKNHPIKYISLVKNSCY